MPHAQLCCDRLLGSSIHRLSGAFAKDHFEALRLCEVTQDRECHSHPGSGALQEVIIRIGHGTGWKRKLLELGASQTLAQPSKLYE
jgi:hypothetical protein